MTAQRTIKSPVPASLRPSASPRILLGSKRKTIPSPDPTLSRIVKIAVSSPRSVPQPKAQHKCQIAETLDPRQNTVASKCKTRQLLPAFTQFRFVKCAIPSPRSVQQSRAQEHKSRIAKTLGRRKNAVGSKRRTLPLRPLVSQYRFAKSAVSSPRAAQQSQSEDPKSRIAKSPADLRNSFSFNRKTPQLFTAAIPSRIAKCHTASPCPRHTNSSKHTSPHPNSLPKKIAEKKDIGRRDRDRTCDPQLRRLTGWLLLGTSC